MTPAVLDIIIATILLLSTGIAFYRGIIHEIFDILGLVVSSASAYFGGPLLIPSFDKWLHVPADGGERAAAAVSKSAGADPATNGQALLDGATRKSELLLGMISPGKVAEAASYSTVFVGAFLLMSLISFFLSRGVEEVGLGFVDRIAGGIYGLTRGFVLVFLPYMLCFVLFAQQDVNKFPDWARNSVSVPILNQAYVFADEKFDLKKRIEDRGGEVALKIQKINPAKLEQDVAHEEQQLKTGLSSSDAQKEPVMP